MKRAALTGAILIALLMGSAQAADTFVLTVLSQTSSTITFGWDAQPGYGYLFSRDGQVVSRTNAASTTTVKFSSGAISYEVAAIAKSAPLTLTVASQTNKTITYSWDPQAGYGYLFFADGNLVSRTNDPSRSTVKFSKGAASYEVATQLKGATGTYPPPGPVGDITPPTQPGNLRASASTQTSITVAWDASTDNVGVTNYRIYRGGTLIGQGPGSAGGFQDIWQDGNRSCGTSYVYGVDAQDAAGNTSARTTATLSTAACSQAPACSDGADNDGDGKVDLADPGCSSSQDTDETDPPPPPPGGTLTPAQLEAACNVAGAVIDNVSVSGSSGVTCNALNVTIRNSRLSGFVLDIDPGASGFRLDNTDISNGGFNIWGADNVTIVDGTFDGGGRVSSNQMWDNPAKNGVNGFLIARNSFSNYRGGDCTVHGEALFIGGYSANGLVEGNTFSNNGCTSHIFFSYFGNDGLSGSNSAQIPRNICVRGNTFGARFLNTYYDINFRQEVAALGPAVTGIKIQPGTATTNPEFDAVC